MGGKLSSSERATGDNHSCTPSTSKNRFISAVYTSSAKLKSSFKRKASSRDQCKPFQDLIKSWPIQDIKKILEEFNADVYLLDLQRISDNSRKKSNCFVDDFLKSRASFGDSELQFKSKSFIVHRDFFLTRCKKITKLIGTAISLPSNFDQFSIEDIENFINFVYSDKWDTDKSVLDKLKLEFGCMKSLKEDLHEQFKHDVEKSNGDLKITVVNSIPDEKHPSDYSFYCNSTVASSRSPLICSLLSRKTGDKSIIFDDCIFPRSLALVFIYFLYCDTLDFSLIPSSDVTISSLSQARAIISGKSPDIQLHRALQIMQVAKFFGVEKMVQACEDIVVKYLTCENCVAVLRWARDSGSRYIATHAKRLIENEFKTIAASTSLFELSVDELLEVTESQFLQVTELELLDACIRWGEHDLLRKLEEREPNVVADTCHSISRRGLRKTDLAGDELKEILRPLANNIRKDYALPPFHQTLTEAYNRGILERSPLSENLIVCTSTSEINPDLHWLKPSEKLCGPRYYRPYHEVLKKHPQLKFQSSCTNSKPIEETEECKIKLEFLNKCPEILDDDTFILAKKRIEDFIGNSANCHQITLLPRIYHKSFAIKLITKSVLTEMDISEELFYCGLKDFDEIAENVLEETSDSIGSSCPSFAPDLLL